jgi:hypothetical protein
MKRYRKSGIVGPLILIGLGIVFLLGYLGIITTTMWDVIISLWPLLLIAIGLDLIIGRRSVWGTLLVLIIVLVVFVGGVYVLETGTPGPAQDGEQIRIPSVGVNNAIVHLKPAAGYLYVSAVKTPGEDLVSGYLRPFSGEHVKQIVQLQTDPASVSLQSEGAIIMPALGRWSTQPSWDFSLHPVLVKDLTTDIGLGKTELDLTHQEIESFTTSIGLGQTVIRLPRSGQFIGDIKGGMGDLLVIIPEGLEVRYRASVGLGYVDSPTGYTRIGDYYESLDYDQGEDAADLFIELGMGIIRFEEE